MKSESNENDNAEKKDTSKYSKKKSKKENK